MRQVSRLATATIDLRHHAVQLHPVNRILDNAVATHLVSGPRAHKGTLAQAIQRKLPIRRPLATSLIEPKFCVLLQEVTFIRIVAKCVANPARIGKQTFAIWVLHRTALDLVRRVERRYWCC
jgi:hypothetical protein